MRRTQNWVFHCYLCRLSKAAEWRLIMKENWNDLLALVPEEPSWKIDWAAIEHTELRKLIEKMTATMQNPLWHGEGDVWSHTKMVCEELVKIPAFRCLERRKQQELFLAALLHDIGKILCTRWEDGAWTSPNHTSVGAQMAREWLWRVYDVCGSEELRTFRETVCNLIRYHSVPPHILEQKKPERRLLKIAAEGELVPDFSVELLCLLEEADIKGRISKDIEKNLELVSLCAEVAREYHCLTEPGIFPDSFSEYAYLSDKNIYPGQKLYNDTWGEVILMSGLPGTGKDTWIQEHYQMPMISLDEIRKQMNISPRGNQSAVVQAAREQAKEYLRKKQGFIWNATNLTPMLRAKQIRLFEDYCASVRIVYLETEWEEMLLRNKKRKEGVPEKVIQHMLSTLIPPKRQEAHYVEWHCV